MVYTRPETDTKSIKMISVLLCLLGIGIQTQILFGVTDSYMGLRLNLGDFVMPCAGVIIFISLLRRRSFWPQWQSPCRDVWFYMLLGLIFMGLGNAYIQEGTLSHWAVFNRGIGWFVLTGYIFFAGWGVTNLSEKHVLIFMKVFLLFTFATIICGTVWFFLFRLESDHTNTTYLYIQFSGLMGNRNAFAFLMICSLVLYTYFDDIKMIILPKIQSYLTYIIWFFLPLAMIFNGSRAGWVGLGLVIVWFLLSKFKYTLRFILPALLLSSLVVVYMYTHNSKSVFREDQNNKMSNLGDAKTDQLRLTVAEDALELWAEHKFLGAGIGSFLLYQENKHGQILDQIDNSALWVLTELGIFGALVFGSFYMMALIALWRTYKTRQDPQDMYGALAQAMMVIMVLFALFSLVHQILYARYLWFLLGVALAKPQHAS